MHFELNEEQRILRDSLRRFLDAEIAPLDRAHGDAEMTPELARNLLARIKPFGYLGRERPDDPIMVSLLYQEMGRVFPSLGGLAFITSVIGPTVERMAHPEVAARLAPPLIEGDLIGCAAYSEPGVGSDPSAIACRARLDGEHYVLDGSKIWISNGHIADVAVVTVQTDPEAGPKGLRQILVDRRETPFESRDVRTIGLRAFPCSELFFDGLRVPVRNRLGGWGDAPQRPSQPNFQQARVICAEIACGIAEHAIEVATHYVQERRQFGREIGRFQMVQGLLAEMVMDHEAARLLTFRARAALGQPDADRPVSIAKAFATEAGVRITSRAMECLGAMGLTEEMGLERRFRDARMWMVPDGTAQIQRLIIGRTVTGFSATRG